MEPQPRQSWPSDELADRISIVSALIALASLTVFVIVLYRESR